MNHVHRDRIDRSCSVVPTRWWGLGILSLARVRARGLLPSWRVLGSLEAELRRLDAVDALIVDDIGYIQQDREEMEVL
jgi:hypothetical protein